EYGTYFIGYSRHLWVTQKMLERMFLGDPPGMHDRLLDFSTAQTGAVFFAPAPRTLSELVEAVQA
ncbi:Dyp-type peroxidase, partial [Pseudomonas aeruginosa]|nr:Dyp-type peroxidase [Pseudomonas aeruginosa]